MIRSKQMRWGFYLPALALFALISMAAPQAWAKKVYLNGVEITGLSNKSFVNVSVRLDAKGNVHIKGKQYKVVKKYADGKTGSPGTTGSTGSTGTTGTTTGNTGNTGNTGSPSASQLNDGYVLVMQRQGKKGSGYRLEITINGKLVRKISIHMPQDVINLNPYLKKGRNTIVIESFKVDRNVGGQLTVQMSKGKIKSGKVYVKPPYYLKYKRVSTEKNNYRHIFPVTIR